MVESESGGSLEILILREMEISCGLLAFDQAPVIDKLIPLPQTRDPVRQISAQRFSPPGAQRSVF